jgi:proteasome accessory factor C
MKVEQQKILRVFKLITLLRSNLGKPVHKLAESLETDSRTVYRYFRLLEALGFHVLKEHSKYRIVDRVENPMDYSYGTFSDEEISFLADIIQKSKGKNLLKDSILQKMVIRSDFTQNVNQIYNANLGLFVDRISFAMREKNQVILKDYYSVSSDLVSDRLVEPICFNKNFDGIYAFEIESMKSKIFKIERIGEVAITTYKYIYEQLHEKLEQGLFGFIGENNFSISLRLSKRAYQLLIEEFPDSIPFCKRKKSGHYIADIEVPQLQGIGRFVLGLPGEIEVLVGDEFKEYLMAQRAKFTF